MTPLRALGLIPARGGSKGLAGKNIRPLLGKPLLAWTVEQALAAEGLHRVVVSTDDGEIAGVAREAGADVPFLRPDELATDDSPVVDTVLHTLDRLEDEGEHYDLLALLEPTSPLRAEGEIDAALRSLSEDGACRSLVSVGPVAHEHPAYMKRLDGERIRSFFDAGDLPGSEDDGAPHRRQDTSAVYYPYGQIFLVRVDALRETRDFYAPPTLAHVVERWQCFEIDDVWDFLCVERIMERRLADGRSAGA